MKPRAAGFGSEGKRPLLGCSMESPQAVLSLLQALRYPVRHSVAHRDDQKLRTENYQGTVSRSGAGRWEPGWAVSSLPRPRGCGPLGAETRTLVRKPSRGKGWTPSSTRSFQVRAARPACVPRTYPSTRCSPEPFLALSRGDLGCGQHRVDPPPAARLQRAAKKPKMAASSAPSSDPKPAPRSPCWRGGRGGGVAATVVAEGRGCSAGGTERTHSAGQACH